MGHIKNISALEQRLLEKISMRKESTKEKDGQGSAQNEAKSDQNIEKLKDQISINHIKSESELSNSNDNQGDNSAEGEESEEMGLIVPFRFNEMYLYSEKDIMFLTKTKLVVIAEKEAKIFVWNKEYLE